MSLNRTTSLLWEQTTAVPSDQVDALSAALGSTHALAQLLLQRGLDDLTKIKTFLKPRWEMLHDPYLMRGMVEATALILKALDEGAHIRIYGDYDVDGTTSVTLLYQMLQSAGVQRLSYYIPDRYKEGYGVSKLGIEAVEKDQVDLLICVDCGTRAVDLLGKAKAAGVQVIICDHHQPAALLPAVDAILNPKHPDCAYPYKELSACGVVFKLIQALQIKRALWTEKMIKKQLDLVALSIAADVVPLTGENRILAALGLMLWQKPWRKALRSMRAHFLQEGQIDLEDLSFGCAPRINAVGRLEHAHAVVHTLLSGEQDQAEQAVCKMDQLNLLRRSKQQQMEEQALAQISASSAHMGEKRYAHVLFNPDWHKGIVGIVASRCVEQVYKPVIILTEQHGYAVGSARSPAAFNITQALEACRAHLNHFGGHAQAAGLTLSIEHLDLFRSAFEAYARAQLEGQALQQRCRIELELPLDQIEQRLIRLLDLLGPFGPAYPKPIFFCGPLYAVDYTIYQERHLKLRLKMSPSSQRSWEAIGFNLAGLTHYVKDQQPFSLAYQISMNHFRGVKRLQLIIKDIQPHPATFGTQTFAPLLAHS